MSIAYPLAAVIAAATAALGIAAYSVHRRQKTASKDAELNAKALYEQGRQYAEDAVEEPGPAARALADAGIDAKPVTWVASLAAIAIVIASFANLAGGPALAALCAVAVPIAAAVRVALGRRKRREQFAEQFVRMLPQLSASVKSSLTLERSIRISADHAPEPLRGELARILAQATYGTPLPVAFESLAKRTSCRDAAALAAAMRVQSRFGGPLSSVLDSIADHANARMRLERELRTELAGTKLAQWFVACSMPAIFAMSYVLNADFAQFYREEPLGWIVLAGALLMEVIGVLACRHVTKCKRALA